MEETRLIITEVVDGDETISSGTHKSFEDAIATMETCEMNAVSEAEAEAYHELYCDLLEAQQGEITYEETSDGNLLFQREI